MENSNSNATANVDVKFHFAPTQQLRWYKPNMTPILQQYWVNWKGEGEWRDVEIVREV